MARLSDSERLIWAWRARAEAAERERDATRNALLMSAAANRGVNAAAEAAEARLRKLEKALRDAEYTISHDIHGCGPRCYCGRNHTLPMIRALLGSGEEQEPGA